MFEYIGNIHIHSLYSDGDASIDEIASYAGDAGLDFIIITDHYNLDGLYNNEEKYKDGVLIMVGMEVNDIYNHYLALDIHKVIKNNVSNPQMVIDEVNHQKGIGIIAHPVEKGSPLFYNGRTYEWNDWSVHDFQGIEIWNFLSQWRDGVTSFLKGLYLLFNPHAALIGPYQQTMAILDRYQSRGKKVLAFGGSDAHGTKLKAGLFKITICPYDLCFRCINMHILTERELSGDVETDKKIIYKALRKGSSWVAYDYFKNSKGFRFNIKGEGEISSIGDERLQTDNMFAEVRTPYPAKAILMKNGLPWQESRGTKHIFKNILPGVYRVEVFHKHGLGWRPWIFSNPIWIIGQKSNNS